MKRQNRSFKSVGKIQVTPTPHKKSGKIRAKVRQNSGKKLVRGKAPKIDGWNQKDLTRLRSAIRQVWSWSEPPKIVRKRCLLPNGFSKCENKKCRKVCPKIFVDHIQVMGPIFGDGYLERMGVPSSKLQGLCKKCHDAKTAIERAVSKQDAEADFF